VSDVYAAPPEPRGRLGCAFFAGTFLLGFLGVVLAALFLRAPGHTANPLGDAIVPPAGYVRLDDAEAGAGEQAAGDVASLLGMPSVAGFDSALSRAWGRAPGEPVRSVVVLVVALDSADRANALADAYVAAHRSTSFSTPAPLHGFRDGPDAGGRYAQRVVFTTDARVWVVSVVTPVKESDTTEVVRIARAQTATS
jgi:hypothetical protein